MDVVDTLNDRFHNLGGTTIAEHKRNFNTFAQELGACKPTEIHAFLKQLEARNNQEELFRVRLLQTHNKHDLLLNLLFEGNKIVGKVIAKDRKLAEQITLNEFLGNICPNVSYAIRMRIICRLVAVMNDAERGERFYEAVYVRYGLRLAQPFLITCSEPFIRTKVTEYGITFEDVDLIKLHRKYPDFLNFYFGECKKYFMGCTVLAEYLINSHISTFHELLKHGEPRIGKRGFLKYLRAYKDDVINNKVFAGKHYRVVHKNVSDEEFLIYFKSLFPKKIIQFNASDIVKVLRVLPLKDRGTVFFRAYEDVYGKKFEEAVVNLMEVLSNEDRMKLNIDPDVQTVYLTIDKSIPLIKEKIVQTSKIQERSKLLVSLLETCKINRDKNALLKVLQYFCLKHRNEVLQVRQEFLQSLLDKFDLQFLNQQSWDCINEVTELFKINEEPFYGIQDLLVPSILRKIKLDQDCTKEVNQLRMDAHCWEKALKQPEIGKKMVLLALGAIDQDLPEDKKSERTLQWLDLLISFNKAAPKYAISYYKYPEIIRMHIDVLDKERYIYFGNDVLASVFTYIPDDDSEKELRLELLKTYVDKYHEYFTEGSLMLVLKYNPKLLEGKFKAILTSKQQMRNQFTYELSKSHFNNLALTFNEDALSVLNNDEKLSSVKNALNVLSYNWKYLDFVKQFQPESTKIDPNEENATRKLGTRKSLLINLKKFPKINQSLFKMILFYSKGDYLQYSLLSLYSILHNTPENQQSIVLSQLLNEPGVSVRKHAIYLQPVLGIQEDALNILKRLGENERNVSIRKLVFRTTFNSMRTSAKPQMLELLIAQLWLLQPKDTESIQMLTTMKWIPKPILPIYLPNIWKYLRTNCNDKCIFKLLISITNEVITKLPNEFCDEVATFSLFHSKGGRSVTAKYIYMYLKTSSNQFDHRIKIIYDKIESTTLNTESIIELGAIIQQVHDLFDTLCSQAIEDTESKDLCSKLKNSLTKLSLPLGKFNIEMLLTTTEKLISFETEKTKNLAEFVVKYQLELIKKHSADFEPIFNAFVEEFLHISNLDVNESSCFITLKFAKELLSVSQEDRVKLLVIKLLPRTSLNDETLVDLYNGVIEILRHQSESIVEIYLSEYFRKKSL